MKKTALSRDTKLRLAHDVTLTVAGDDVVADVGAGPIRGHVDLLDLVQVFRSPTTIEAALVKLAATRLDWMELSAEIMRLHRKDILVSEGREQTPLGRGYGSARLHVAMLDDAPRTKSYVKAIRAMVTPGDVVVDVGTGTGVLAIAAAQAGARRVYAIERTAIADVAQRMFVANGVADRITLLRGLSTRLELPERADLMVSELVGNGPFDEHILAYTRDALRRFLVDSPRMVPAGLRVYAQPVTAARDIVCENVFDSVNTRRWSDDYGLDFSPLARERTYPALEVMVRRERVQGCARLGPSTEIVAVDLLDPPREIDARFAMPITGDGSLDAVVVHFRLDLGAGHSMVSDPWSDEAAVHWGIPLWLFPTGRMVSAGATVGARYRFTGVRAMLTLD